MEQKKVLICSVYSAEPIMVAATRLKPDKLVLIIDEKPLYKKAIKEQKDSLNLIKKSLGLIMEVEVVKSPAYDVVATAKKTVDIIDTEKKDSEVFVNVTSGRKTLALGLLFGAYARDIFVKKIAYNPEEDKTAVLWLPKMKFHVTKSQLAVMDELDKNKFSTKAELAANLKLSTAMTYRALEELNELGYVKGMELTDAGRIARL